MSFKIDQKIEMRGISNCSSKFLKIGAVVTFLLGYGGMAYFASNLIKQVSRLNNIIIFSITNLSIIGNEILLSLIFKRIYNNAKVEAHPLKLNATSSKLENTMEDIIKNAMLEEDEVIIEELK